MSERFWYLKRCDLFEHLSADEVRRVESRCRARRFTRNHPIYLPADEADGVLLLTTGRVKICNLTDQGKQAILAFVEPGELFGELAIIEPGQQREEYAETVEPSTLLMIPADEIQRLVEEHPQVSLRVTKLIGLRRRRIERRLKYLLFNSNRDRLVHLLLELAGQYGRPADRGVDLGIKLSHQDLANLIGSTRETVSVLLGRLASQGYLTRGRRQIMLTDVNRLAASVNVPPPRSGTTRQPTTAGAFRPKDRPADYLA